MLLLAAILSACGATSGETPGEGEVPTAIRTSDALRAVAASTVFFGHQSVGMNILDGIPAVYRASGVPAPEIVQSSAPPSVEAAIAHDYIGANGDPASKTAAFAERVRSGYGERADVAFMKFCYVDFAAGSDVQAIFNDYRTTMEALEEEYPLVSFLHLTAPLTTEPGLKDRVKVMLGRGLDHVGDNVAREQYNDLIRAEYGATGRLVDVAAMESTSPTGERVSGESNGVRHYALYEGYASDYGHLNEVGAQAVAEGMLDVIARNVGG